MNPKVDAYIRRNKKWREELAALREILLHCRLTEELKWRAPCYTFDGGNVAILGAFKEYCALSFFKGALLADPQGILQRPGKNTQAGRVIRFSNAEDIEQAAPALKAILHEAIKAEKAGLKVKFKTNPETIPEELQNKLDELPALKAAFEALTPGRRRGYILHFTAPKQSKTRTARIEKCIQQILEGKGLLDDYQSMKRAKRKS